MHHPILRLDKVHFAYKPEQGEPIPALQGIDLEIAAGERVAILGHNGSGKSTLARHLNALLLPDGGEVWVNGINTRERNRWREIRASVGMVFQSPDNQIVATIVEEDVAFGPENLGVPREDIVRRVDWALDRVDMQPFRLRAPHTLSGGQKQRICIAGVLAIQPQVLVLDEATAMLDPLGRREVLDIVKRLHQREGVTVVAITHLMEEAVDADRVIVMSRGQIAVQGTPRDVFAQADALRALQMTVPQITQLAQAVQRRWSAFPADVLSVAEFVVAAQRVMRETLTQPEHNNHHHVSLPSQHPHVPIVENEAEKDAVLIDVKHLAHDYMLGTPLQVRAIEDVSFDVRRGEVLGLIGHTGSGKSTVIQHLNRLMRPQTGDVTLFGQDARSPALDALDIRRRVGLVFQFPEAQLFEQYVGDDVAYGPRNLKLSREEVRAHVRTAMESVGLDFESFKDRLTFRLSGGEKRRVAIAGTLALKPEIVVLDEPTAGLDPQGREQLLEQLLLLREGGMTLVLVSHNMEELARVCDRICVLDRGRTVMLDRPERVFSRIDDLRALGLDVPPVTDAMAQLGFGTLLTVGDAADALTNPHNPQSEASRGN